MPTYNFTSDLRISELRERIAQSADLISSNKLLEQDKSTQNNGNTLAFYFNLQPNTNTMQLALQGRITEVIRNMVLKFQYPNPYTSELLEKNVTENTYIAPLREIVKILAFMFFVNGEKNPYLSYDEIRYHIFCNPQNFLNKEPLDYAQIIKDILIRRDSKFNYTDLIESELNWPQFDRQSREMIKVITFTCCAFEVKKNSIALSLPDPLSPEFSDCLAFISSVMNYNYYWEPSHGSNSELRESYQKYYDINGDVEYIPQTYNKCKLSNIGKSAHYLYLRAMRAKPFLLLAGISGTGKSRIVKELAFDSCPDDPVLRQDRTSPGNYCLIEVKPNWHDSTELLGYKSAIKNTYELTPFIKFLAKAMLYPNVPFFVCLDEMNLAPVEQYFAEFLSVLESRKKLESGEIVSEPLIKAEVFCNNNLLKDLFPKKEEPVSVGYAELAPDDIAIDYCNSRELAVYDMLKREGLRIPQNVVVIGTVNMDETTHQFSRKVIDRAMTIEMNLPEGNPFMDFFTEYRELGYRDMEQPRELYLSTNVSADKVVDKLRESNPEMTEWLLPEVARVLTSINNALDGTPFKVAYRVQNELMLYFGELWSENHDADWHEILSTSVDQILMMKVLPRIEGDEDLLRKPLERLASLCSGYPNALKKVREMEERLDHSQFTSFWP